MTEITIVGGGIAGLVAAITIAEGGGSATLFEASPKLGGRGRTDDGPYRANVGAHALYHGAFTDWLAERKLMPPSTPPKKTAFKLARDNRILRLPLALLPMLRSLKREAPSDLDYRSWAGGHMSLRSVEAAIGFASLPTFHGDPGSLSAAFVHERLQRSFTNPSVSYTRGGFGAIVDALAEHARSLGVRIETGHKVSELPDGPTIIATDLRTARRLLDDPSIEWRAPRTAMFDVALRPHRRDRKAVLDLDRRVYVSDYSAYDPTLAPEGEHLYQCIAGLRDDEDLAAGIERIQAVLDLAVPEWRTRSTWKRQGLSEGAGAADRPGTTWRDRPAIERGPNRWLAGDRVAAPGILCEPAFVSGQLAATRALESVTSTPRPVRAVA